MHKSGEIHRLWEEAQTSEYSFTVVSRCFHNTADISWPLLVCHHSVAWSTELSAAICSQHIGEQWTLVSVHSMTLPCLPSTDDARVQMSLLCCV